MTAVGGFWPAQHRGCCRSWAAGTPRVLCPCSFSQDIPVPLRHGAPAVLAQGGGLGVHVWVQEPGLPKEPPPACPIPLQGPIPGRRWWLCPPSPQLWWQRGTPVAIPALLSPLLPLQGARWDER